MREVAQGIETARSGQTDFRLTVPNKDLRRSELKISTEFQSCFADALQYLRVRECMGVRLCWVCRSVMCL